MDDVEKPDPDASEQEQGLEEDDEESFPVPDDANEADAIEQHRPVRPHGEADVRVPDDANEADVWEQALDAGDDEEEDRR